MSTASENVTCIVCGQALTESTGDCRACGVGRSWQDLLAANRFARECFQQWTADGLMGVRAVEAIDKFYAERWSALTCMAKDGASLPSDSMLMAPDRCWNCRATVPAAERHCANCGVPVQSPLVAQLRYLTYVCHETKAHCDDGRLPLSQAHACMNAAKARIAGLRGRLQRERVARAEVVQEATPAERAAAFADAVKESSERRPPLAAALAQDAHAAASPAPRPPRKPLLEILLDPRTIQWLLGLGGVLLVLGLIIWLATLGIFKNPIIVAVALGIGNGAVLLGGWAVIRYTRYQTAGRALTLLACLVMPLNLWFYHANNLITLDNHLWVAALVCCVLYLASALVLRDRLFVYVFTGGIAMTGLLMLADNGRFWEIASPAAMLVVLGLLSIHVERAFPEVDGPFGRRKFGTAFFQSGHVLLASGLLLVFGAQLTGDWLYRPLFASLYQNWNLQPPAIVTEAWGRFVALAIILAGSYAYFYSDIIVRRVGLYVYLAVFTLLWAEMFVIELVVARDLTAEAAILALAITAFVVNLLQPQLARLSSLAECTGSGAEKRALSFIRAGQPLGLFLCTVPVLLGVVLHLRATYQPLNEAWPLPGGASYQVGWLYVLAMLATAVSCRFGAYLYRHSVPWLSATYFFGTAAATLTGVIGLLSLAGFRSWDELAPLVMIVPIFYILAARVYRGHTAEKPVALVGHAATGVMIVSVLAAALHLTPQHVFEPVAGKSLNLLLAAFFAEVALFYGLAATFRKQSFSIYLGTAAACGALWQLLLFWHVGGEYYTLTFALLGFGLLICYRLALLEWTGLADAAFQCANALMSLSFVAAGLMTISKLLTHQVEYSLVFLLLGLGVLSLLAAWLVRDPAGRRWYVVMAIAEGALMFLTLHLLSQLNVWQKLEIFSVVAGLAMLVVGHIGWHREQDQQNDIVSFALFFGSLLAGVPLMIAVLIYRGQAIPYFSTLNELGMLLVGLVLLTTGFVFQLRATTITGAGLLLVYVLSMVLFIKIPENMQTAAIWLTIGGGLLFATGILLSVYRDRLLTLPDKVRRREGVFRVLSWR